MQIFRYIHGRLGVALIVAIAMAGTLMPGPAIAQETDDYLRHFHSFVPAQPLFKLQKHDGAVVWGSDMRKAKGALRRGDYVKARKHLQNALEKGNVIAAWYLGHLYRQGRGVKRDDGAAFTYYRKVAVTYEPDMQLDRRLTIVVDSLVRVADVYREGSKSAGVARDPRRAFRIYNVAISHRHPGADYGLGVMYLNGIGVNKNPDRALSWLNHAARQRFAPAAAKLGDLYWEGSYVRRTRVHAYAWYLLALETAGPDIRLRIKEQLKVSSLQLNEKQRATARALAQRWSEKYPVKDGIVPVAD